MIDSLLQAFQVLSKPFIGDRKVLLVPAFIGILQRIDVGPAKLRPTLPQQVGMGDDFIPQVGVQTHKPFSESFIKLYVPFHRASPFHVRNIFHPWHVVNFPGASGSITTSKLRQAFQNLRKGGNPPAPRRCRQLRLQENRATGISPVAGKLSAESPSRRKEAAHLMENAIDQYIQRILDYLKDSVLLDPSKEIPLDQSLVETGILDSYGIVDLLTFIEGEFGLAIPEKDITKEKMGSIRKMARYIAAGKVMQA
jgi:acyl carrier protein